MNSFLRFLFFIIGSFYFFPLVIHAQSEENLIYLHHADSLIGIEINGERARQLIGNVKFTHGKTIVTCRRAIQFLQSNKATLEGDVIVTEDSLRMSARRGVYNGNTRIAEAYGNVRLDDQKMVLYADEGIYYSEEKKAFFRQHVILLDSSGTLTADALTYFREEQKTIAEDNVKIVNGENNTTILGGHFENYKKLKFSRMLDYPKAINYDTTGGKTDSVIIVSDTMETYQETPQKLIAIGNVAMKRSDVSAEAGSGLFFTKLDSIELRRSPFVWHIQSNGTTTQASGDSMFIKLEKQKLKTLYVHGHSFSISEAEPTLTKRFHQLSGQDMTMTFKENKLNNIEVDKTATILYYLFDDKTPNGLNHTTGDHVTINFLDSKIDRLKVIGGVEGKYVPERLVVGQELEYNLTGFNWKQQPIVR